MAFSIPVFHPIVFRPWIFEATHEKTSFITAIGSGNYLLVNGPKFPNKIRAEKEGNFCAPQKGSRESFSSSKDNDILVGGFSPSEQCLSK